MTRANNQDIIRGKESSPINITGRYDEDTWIDQNTGEPRSQPLIILDDNEFDDSKPKTDKESDELGSDAPTDRDAPPAGQSFAAYESFGYVNVSVTQKIYTGLRKNHQIKNVGQFSRSMKKLQEEAYNKRKSPARLPGLTTNLTTKYVTTLTGIPQSATEAREGRKRNK